MAQARPEIVELLSVAAATLAKQKQPAAKSYRLLTGARLFGELEGIPEELVVDVVMELHLAAFHDRP